MRLCEDCNKPIYGKEHRYLVWHHGRHVWVCRQCRDDPLPADQVLTASTHTYRPTP